MKNVILILFTIFIISCDKEVTTTQPEPPPPRAKIFIDSDPSGTQIWANNKNTGRNTPDSISWIEEGEYLITLKKKYYKDTSFSITAKEDLKVSEYIDYFKNPTMYGEIEFYSNPQSAEIFVNDSALGLKTPAKVGGWIPGEYKIDYKIEGYRANKLNIIVESDKLTKASVALKDTTVWVDYLTSNSDIPSNILTCIAVDKNDLLWIGTDTDGLITFNGSAFNQLNSQNSNLTSNKINSIHVDNQNNKWICTNSGLIIIDDQMNFTIYNTDNSILSTNTINTVYFVNDNYVLVGTASGLYKIEDGIWRAYSSGGIALEGTNLSLLWINDIVTKEDTVFLGTTHLGVVSLWGNRNYTIYETGAYNKNFSKYVKVLEKDQNANLWFGFNSSYYYLDGIRHSYFGGITEFDGASWYGTKFPNYSDAFFESLFIDDKDNKWYSAENGLFRVKEFNSVSKYTNLNWGLTVNHTTGVTQRSDKVYWITTLGGGLIKYKGS
ncbi:MAG: PEGA domain-containing protein [Ignavibacteriae bacterium]|nr:PEGA domain-containing protein [Ignavibacteriota bacterium]MCB9211368.1 PEGA domain-containing protein [Ignavibacteriales bacterium]MCB9219774.1 PEGA domain-containing protein [Ignavibacteriales bacterium]MCB9260035.1 PEGA domain-containing protein [Ignavibacteriales bacterium]